MPDLDFIRADIEFMRVQVGRLRKEILQLQRAGISTASAEALLQRMLTKIEGAVRGTGPAEGAATERQSAGRAELVKHFHDDPDPPPFIKALAEVRQLAARGRLVLPAFPSHRGGG